MHQNLSYYYTVYVYTYVYIYINTYIYVYIYIGVDTAAVLEANSLMDDKLDIKSAVTVLTSVASDRPYASAVAIRHHTPHHILDVSLLNVLDMLPFCVRTLKTFDGMTLRYIHIHIYVDTFVYVYICIYIYIYIYIYLCVYIFICMYVYICMYIYVHIYIHICVYRNSIVIALAMKKAKDLGATIVLTGDGADELLGIPNMKI
jgi:hypothetical protein